MSDAELVVGARNEAKAVLDEIGSQLSALAIPAQEGSLKVDAAISGLLAKLAAGAVAVTGAFGAAAVAVGSIAAGSAIKSINDEAKAIDALNRELDNYVGKSRISEQAARAFADANRLALGVAEKETIALLTSASAMGVSQGKLDEAALAAIGLSKALGIDLNSALKKVVEGDDRLVSMLDSVNSGLREQSTEVDGLSGLWNRFEMATQRAFDLLIESTGPIQTAISDLGEAITDGLTRSIVGAISALDVYQNNFDLTNELLLAKWDLTYLQMEETAKFTFTKQIPNYLKNMREQAGSTFSYLSNQWSGVLSAVMKRIAGKPEDIENFNANLLKAFGAKYEPPKLVPIDPKDMPKMTEQEKDLTEQIRQISEKLGKEFSSTFQDNLNKFNVEIPKLNESDLQGLKQDDTKDAKSSTRRQQDLQAVESRLLTRGRVDNAMDKVAQATQASADRLKSIDENLKNTNVTKEKLELEFVA